MHNKYTNRKKASGIVYSTNPDFIYNFSEQEEPDTPLPEKQHLTVKTDSKNRKGKTVTLIEGFTGKTEDLKYLEKDIKTFCGTGGSAKDGVIILQGNLKEKAFNYLVSKNYKARKI